MKIHESQENYLETILILTKRTGQVRSIDIATELGFSKPSVSVALKHLRLEGYAIVDKDGYITLTDSGKEIAERVYAKHEVISELLITLGVDKKTALEDACRIEHVISQESFEKLAAHAQELKKL